MAGIINSVLTNQFFLMFLAIATGLLIGKIKIRNFSLGVSGSIFTGIAIGYLATAWAHGVSEGGIGFANKGHIVNIGSCSVEVSSVSRGEYCISKAAVSMLTTLYADRLAPEGIVVNEVRPGVIATSMTSVVTEKYNKMFADGVFPIARWGEPEDVAGVVSLFCSDRMLYTTGNYVDVDGGFHIKRL